MTKIQVRIPDVLQMLKDGKSREEISNHYGLSKRDTKLLFQHKDLKGKRTHLAPAFEIVSEEISISAVTDSAISTQDSQDEPIANVNGGEMLEKSQWINA